MFANYFPTKTRLKNSCIPILNWKNEQNLLLLRKEESHAQKTENIRTEEEDKVMKLTELSYLPFLFHFLKFSLKK